MDISPTPNFSSPLDPGENPDVAQATLSEIRNGLDEIQPPGPDLTRGIPQSGAYPFHALAGPMEWDREAEKQARIQAANAQAEEDDMVLNPEKHFSPEDLGFIPDPVEAQRLAVNDRVLARQFGTTDVPLNGLERRLKVQDAALARFGEPIDSEEDFHARLVKDATERKDQNDLVAGKDEASSRESLLGKITEAAVGQKGWQGTFLDWQKSAASDPRFKPERLSEYQTTAETAYNEIVGKVSEAMPFADQALEALKHERDNVSVFGTSSSIDAVRAAPKELRPMVLALLDRKAREEGEKEGKGWHAWQTFGRGALSDPVGGVNFLENRTLIRAEDALDKLKPGDEYGGRFESLIDYARGQSSEASESRMLGWLLEPVLKNNVVTEESLAEAKRRLEQQRDEFELSRQMQQIGNGTLSPLRADSWLGEKIGYPLARLGGQMAPGFALGALAGGGRAFVALVGVGSMAGMMADEAQQQVQAANPEMSFRQSYEIGRNAAATQAALQFGADMLTLGMAPGLGKSLKVASAPVLANFTKSLVTHGLLQNAIVGAQDLAVPTVQALTKNAPSVNWHDVFYGKQGWIETRADAALMLLPLVVMGAGGSALRAKASLPELQRIAAITENESLMKIARITPEGRARISAEADPARKLDIFEQERGKAGDDVAAEGLKEFDEQKAKAEQLEREGQRAGIIPTFRISRDGIEVRDPSTGEVIGAPAQDADAAVRIASDHFETMRQMNADQVAAMASMLEASHFTTGSDEAGVRRTTVEFSPSERRTVADELGANPQDEASLLDRMRIEEQMDGSPADFASLIAGQSETEFRGRQRDTLNKLFAGSTVQDLLHESTHGWFREALATGRLTEAESIQYIRTLQNAVGDRARGGRSLDLIPHEGDVSPRQLDEAVSKLFEAEILRTRDGGTQRTEPGKGGGALAIPSSIITKNLTATARLAPGATRKFVAFANAVRSYFGQAMRRALAIKKAIREGKLSEGEHQAFISKLLGFSEQDGHEAHAREITRTIFDGEGDPFSIRRDHAEAKDDIPREMGRAQIQPEPGTKVVHGENGTVVGPAAFSIRAYHGTPHEVDGFTTERIGTGEGRQVFGWGLYFAESRKVAAQYRDQLGAEFRYKGKTLLRRGDIGPAGAELKEAVGGDNYVASVFYGYLPEGKAKVREELLHPDNGFDPAHVELALKALDDIEQTKEGNLYRVELKPEAKHLLDWDKPFEEQSEEVQAALDRISVKMPEAFHEELIERLNSDFSDLTGKEIYKVLARWASEDALPGDKSLGGDPARETSEFLHREGIPGIQYLDGNSRRMGEGTRNFVVFDHADISITGANDTAHSMRPAAMADALIGDVTKLIRAPRARIGFFTRMAENLGRLRRETDEIGNAFGKNYTRKAIVDPATKTQIQRRARVFEALRRAELEDAAQAKHMQILSNDDLTKLRAQPVHSELSTESPLRGRLRSPSKAEARMEAQGQTELIHGGDYDGSEGVSRSVFGGDLAPDQAAQELYEKGLLREPTTDALWDALKREGESVANMKRYRAAAEEDLRGAKKQAKTEAAKWEADSLAEQERDYSTKARLLRAMAALDGIMGALPPELRGRVGGYTRLATLESDNARLKYLQGRVEKAGEVVEIWLRAEADTSIKKLFKKSELVKGKPGERPQGKATPDVQAIMDTARKAIKWDAGKAQDEVAKLESRIRRGIADGTLPADEQLKLTTQSQVIQLVGDWDRRFVSNKTEAERDQIAMNRRLRQMGHDVEELKDSRDKVSDGADATRRWAAASTLERIWSEGYAQARLEALQRAENRAVRFEALKNDTQAKGDEAQVAAHEEDLKGLAAITKRSKEIMLGLYSFDQFMHSVFGEKSQEAGRLVEMKRDADYRKLDLNQATDAIVEDFMASLAARSKRGKVFDRLRMNGHGFDAELLQRDLAEVRQDVDAKGRPQEGSGVVLQEGDGKTRRLSQLQAVDLTMMWRQQDGRRHMEGAFNEKGEPTSAWHYTQEQVDAVEAQLSPAAKQVRSFLTTQYAGEWGEINPTFRRLFNADLPNNPEYSPLSVEPAVGESSAMRDPITGLSGEGSSLVPGSFKTRGTAVAKPRFMDAMQKFMAHKRDMNHFLSYAEFAQEAQSLLSRRELQAAVKERGGQQSATVLRQWLDFFNTGGKADAANQLALMQSINSMTGNAAAATLAGRVSVLAVQSTQLLAGSLQMPVGSFLYRLGQLTTSPKGWRMWASALDSPYIQRRIKEMPPVVRALTNGLKSAKPNAMRHTVGEMGKLIGGADGLFTAGTYAMILDYQRRVTGPALKLTGDALEAFAHHEAARLTDEVAQPVGPGSRSLVENTATSPIMRLGWAFASEQRQKTSILAYKLAAKDVPLAQRAKAVSLVLIVGGLVPAMIRAVLNDARDGGDDETFDSKNWSIPRLTLQTLFSPAKGVPFIGDALEGSAYALAGQRQQEGNLFGNMAQGAAGAADAVKMVTGDKDASADAAMKDAEAILGAIGLFNKNAGAASSLSHAVRDAYRFIKTGLEAAGN